MRSTRQSFLIARDNEDRRDDGDQRDRDRSALRHRKGRRQIKHACQFGEEILGLREDCSKAGEKRETTSRPIIEIDHPAGGLVRGRQPICQGSVDSGKEQQVDECREQLLEAGGENSRQPEAEESRNDQGHADDGSEQNTAHDAPQAIRVIWRLGYEERAAIAPHEPAADYPIEQEQRAQEKRHDDQDDEIASARSLVPPVGQQLSQAGEEDAAGEQSVIPQLRAENGA